MRLSLLISLVGLLMFACYRFARFWLVCCVSDVACFCWVLIFVMVEFDCATLLWWFWFVVLILRCLGFGVLVGWLL